MARIILSLALIVLASQPANSQGFTIYPAPYDVETDPPLVLRNDGSQPVTLDSLAFDREPGGGGYDAIGWTVSLSARFGDDLVSTEVFCSVALNGGCEPLPSSLDRPFAPGDSVALVLSAACEACRGGGGRDFRDSLRVYTSGDPIPARVGIAADFPVSAESGPDPLALRIRPSVTRKDVTLDITLGRATDTEVVVFDALGRRAFAVRRVLGPGANSVRLDLSRVPAGGYTVRVQAGEVVSGTRVTVVR